MMSLYSGTPGSGKSLSMCKEVAFWLKSLNKNVIANTRINRKFILGDKKGGRFYYFSNDVLTPDLLYKYALRFHKLGVESQTLIVMDEAQVKFSPTAVKLFTQEDNNYRQDWLEFFTQHRHLGFDVIIISQFDRLIDAQVRCLFEYNFVHRKANNLGALGIFLSILHIPLFVQIQHWYGARQVCGHKFFLYRHKYSKMYDSYSYRSQILSKLEQKYGKDKMQELMGIRPKKVKKVEEKEEVVSDQVQQEKKVEEIKK